MKHHLKRLIGEYPGAASDGVVVGIVAYIGIVDCRTSKRPVQMHLIGNDGDWEGAPFVVQTIV